MLEAEARQGDAAEPPGAVLGAATGKGWSQALVELIVGWLGWRGT